VSAPGARPMRPRNGSMFRHIFKHGLLFLVITAAAVMLANVILANSYQPRGSMVPAARYFADLQGRHLDDPAERARLLRQLALNTRMEVTLYAMDGTLIDSTVDPALPPLSGEDVALIAEGGKVPGRGSPAVAPLMKDGVQRGYLLLRLIPPGIPWHHLLITLTFIVGALALVSVPMARAISAPIEHLMASVRRFGAGDLGARSGLTGTAEVGQLGIAFDEMADRLQFMIRREKQLLAGVSHELRTPLARIRIALEMAEEGAGGSKHYLEEIGIDLAELERLIEDVLATARLELATDQTGQTMLGAHYKRIDSARLLEQSAARFRQAHPERELKVELAQGLPELDAHPELLRRAVDNLLDNARKYSDDVVRLSARPVEGGVEIEVQDRGIGIDVEDQPHLFTPFFRTDRSRTRGTGGVGMGLALTRRIIQEHGGEIGVVSASGEGSTFRLTLPAAPASGA